MRFLSKYGSYAVQIQPEIVEPFATGQVRVLQKSVIAQFQAWGMQPLERELAMAHWGNSFNGFYQEQDEVTIVPPDYRIGVFDSIAAAEEFGWDEATRKKVEEVLVETGKITDNTIAIPLTVVPPPWPRYDEFAGTPQQLLQRLVEDGYDIDAVLEYERGNQNRDDVVAVLATVAGDPDALLELQGSEEIVG